MSHTRILGIDPGLRSTGFGIIDVEKSRFHYVVSGTITTGPASEPLSKRLQTLFKGICEINEKYQPHQSACEIIFVNSNPQSSLLLGQARGACLTALSFCNLPVAEYSALQLKKSIVGHGHAKKEQMQDMICRLLKLPAYPSKDAADALGLAITHAHAKHMEHLSI